METNYEFNTLITDKKKKAEYSGSIFLITINSNKSYNSRDIGTVNNLEEIENCFKELSEKLFKNNAAKLLVQVEGRGTDKKIIPLEKDDIKNIDSVSQLEVNKDGRGFIHMHTTLTVIHKKKIQINLELLKRVVYRKMEPCLTIDGKYYKPYVNVRGKKSDYSILNYVKN